MANIFEPADQLPPDRRAAWNEWYSSRPDTIRAMIDRWPPWKLYRLKDTGHRVTMRSYGEDGTVSVDVSGKYNFVLLERNVFGVNPEDLTECDLPAPGEPVGVADPNDPRLTDEQRAILSRAAHCRMTQPGEN